MLVPYIILSERFKSQDRYTFYGLILRTAVIRHDSLINRSFVNTWQLFKLSRCRHMFFVTYSHIYFFVKITQSNIHSNSRMKLYRTNRFLIMNYYFTPLPVPPYITWLLVNDYFSPRAKISKSV